MISYNILPNLVIGKINIDNPTFASEKTSRLLKISILMSCENLESIEDVSFAKLCIILIQKIDGYDNNVIVVGHGIETIRPRPISNKSFYLDVFCKFDSVYLRKIQEKVCSNEFISIKAISKIRVKTIYGRSGITAEIERKDKFVVGNYSKNNLQFIHPENNDD